MERIIQNNKIYTYFDYQLENDFEKVIVENSDAIFGNNSIYIDIKKRIGRDILTIPDGYLIDYTFPSNPRLFIIENELSSHDPYKHIGSQLLKFAISYKESGFDIKNFIKKHLEANNPLLQKMEEAIKLSEYQNIDEYLEDIIFHKPVASIVVIDKSTPELENVLSQLTMDTDIIQFQTFVNGKETIHKFDPFNVEIRDIQESKTTKVKATELDTVVVPAQSQGFKEEFLKNNYWFAIRISASMLDRIKYIAAYQTAPTSAITHYAEISRIEKWNNTNKYILYFKDKAIKINPIKLASKKKGIAPQAPRYTSFSKLIKAKTFTEVF
jgi:predicted DNA binding CopG/RHH family protein